jgi:hypothetical protein
MKAKMRVMFLRLRVDSSDEIEKELGVLYGAGWRVVSHSECDGEYSFVLEMTHT